MIREQIMKKEEMMSCKVRIELRSQTPFLLLEKFPFSVLIGLKFERYNAGINPEMNENTIKSKAL